MSYPYVRLRQVNFPPCRRRIAMTASGKDPKGPPDEKPGEKPPKPPKPPKPDPPPPGPETPPKPPHHRPVG